MGALYLIVGLLLYVFKEYNDREITNPEIFIGILATGGGLLGIGIIEYFKHGKNNGSTKS